MNLFIIIIVGILTSVFWAHIIPRNDKRRNKMGRLRGLIHDASFGEKLVGFAIAVVVILVLFNS